MDVRQDRPIDRCPVRGTASLVVAWVCVGLAAVGAFVPGMPTTIFLILAAGFFARSRPDLTRRVMRFRPFRPLRPFVLGDEPMPRSARNRALAAMWIAILASSALIVATERAPDAVAVLTMALGVVGTVAIVRVARSRRTAAPIAVEEREAGR